MTEEINDSLVEFIRSKTKYLSSVYDDGIESTPKDFEDDCCIHISRGKYRFCFYNGDEEDSFSKKDIKRFSQFVDKCLDEFKTTEQLCKCGHKKEEHNFTDYYEDDSYFKGYCKWENCPCASFTPQKSKSFDVIKDVSPESRGGVCLSHPRSNNSKSGDSNSAMQSLLRLNQDLRTKFREQQEEIEELKSEIVKLRKQMLNGFLDEIRKSKRSKNK